MSYLTGFLTAQVGNLAGDIHILNAKIRELRAYREEDAQTIVDQAFAIEQWSMHHAAEKKLRIALMDELDSVYGKDKNPFRKQAYTDPEAMRIPSGDQKGQVVTKADHIYLSKCADVFKKNFAGKFKIAKNWKEMLHDRISY